MIFKNSDNKDGLLAADSGRIFTAAELSMLVISLVFSIGILIFERASGMQPEVYGESFTYKLISYLLSSVALFAAMAVYSGMRKINPLKALPFHKTHWKYYIIAVVMAFGLLFGFAELNTMFEELLQKLGFNIDPVTLPNTEWWQYVIWIFAVALLPAVFEESLFRGFICEGLRSESTLFSVLAGGFLFSVFHQSPQQTIYQFICGAAFCLVAVKSRSLFPCILMHFLNNFTIITTDFFGVGEFGKAATIVLTALGVAAFIGCIVYLCAFDKGGRKEPKNTESGLNHTKTAFFKSASIGVAICLVMWVLNLLAGTKL